MNCASCPNGTTWDQNASSCKVTVQNPNGSNPAGQDKALGPLATGSVPCPESYPFFNGTSCINCQSPKPIFNTTSLTCTSCKGGYYNETDHQCYYYNGTNPSGNNNIINPTEVTSPYTVFCPESTPYFNGTTCISCNGSTPYFDQSQNVCVNCPQGTNYNSNTKSCEGLAPNASNPVGNNSAIGSLAPANPNDIPCPADKPFFVNG